MVVMSNNVGMRREVSAPLLTRHLKYSYPLMVPLFLPFGMSSSTPVCCKGGHQPACGWSGRLNQAGLQQEGASGARSGRRGG